MLLDDKELRELRDRLGEKEFRRAYQRLYQDVRNAPNKRYSGKHYENSPEKLKAIREKYRNGVTKEQINKMLEELK